MIDTAAVLKEFDRMYPTTIGYHSLGENQKDRVAEEVARIYKPRPFATHTRTERAMRSLYHRHRSRGLTTKYGGPCEQRSECAACGCKVDLILTPGTSIHLCRLGCDIFA